MSGGGARAAYQVGVLKAIAELLPEKSDNPFPIICGTSAGAINGAALAIHATRFQEGVRRLALIWNNFQVNQVYRADAIGILRSGVHWISSLLSGGLGKRNPRSLLDRAPLYDLLSRYLPCEKIQDSITDGALHAFSVTASGYTTGQSVTFFQGTDSLTPWKRARRVGSATEITIDHLMASSAIPFVFSAVKVNREYFGDGSMRQVAPLSPALHLGADRILVIGVRQESEEQPPRVKSHDYPSLAQIAGHVLNSIFLDSLEVDLERLQRVNNVLRMIPAHYLAEAGVALRPVDVMAVSPSQDLAKIAERHAHHMPRPVRFLLRGIGAINRSGSNLVSYLLFDKSYCRELIELGYQDAMKNKERLLDFLGAQPQQQGQAIRKTA
ncbi:MAG: patatin-like phospholipase family protein [Gammaproteobacteria bacterium]|nr:patatin-like phospholipase family protein [Gammaproteobacteria bacterium]